ncbi:DUF6879 family protein [Allonocardiopsis opalescens]|uniref:DUF6879 domain-containing protein n=1 Tax=Allonocardiopsis opalescens TaxID=1144618 RepID=A0A2T0Q9C2_9ACTN|nr:DUF6879 family protein [Allonocardiopsis opalescens]PRY00489.1 hypothetical protein CLV72_102120 [Allonocardiopsis opalescens]
MLERVRAARGVRLSRTEYHADFDRVAESVTGVMWKLERSQTFREPDDPAWRSFVAGEWDEVLSLFDAERDDIAAEVAKDAERGVRLRRLRVVEEPVSAYLQWEMHSFKVLAECGVDVRVVGAQAISEWEVGAPVPEMVVLGDRVLYEVLYDESWAPCGARRIDDPEVVAGVVADIGRLYAGAEPLIEYFDREIAPLPPPKRTAIGSQVES